MSALGMVSLLAGISFLLCRHVLMYSYPKLPEEYEHQDPGDGLPSHEVAQLKGHEGPVFAVRYNQQGTYCVTGGKHNESVLPGVNANCSLLSSRHPCNPLFHCLGSTYRAAAAEGWPALMQPCECHQARGIQGTMSANQTQHVYAVQDVYAMCVCDAICNAMHACVRLQVFIWDVSTARFIRKLKGHDSTVNAVGLVTYAANDDCLVTAGYDQCVKIWDCKSRSMDPMQTMKAFKVSFCWQLPPDLYTVATYGLAIPTSTVTFSGET
eukprot:1160639-Pelagomonas_calceolata.AAC.2